MLGRDGADMRRAEEAWGEMGGAAGEQAHTPARRPLWLGALHVGACSLWRTRQGLGERVGVPSYVGGRGRRAAQA